MGYIVVRGDTILDLVREVNSNLDEGWKIVGGVAYNSNNGTYLQAMIKE